MRNLTLSCTFFFVLLLLVGPVKAHKHEHEHHPLAGFVPNYGQFHPQVKFKHVIPAGALFYTGSSLVYHLHDAQLLSDWHTGVRQPDTTQPVTMQYHAFAMQFIGGNATATRGNKKAPFYHNYYHGNNPKKHASRVPVYEEAVLQNLYPGIDLKAYNLGDDLKYDFLVAPGQDPEMIRWTYAGVGTPEIKGKTIEISTALGTVTEYRPYAYQLINGKEHEVACRFVQTDTVFGFEFPKGYDSTQILIIDPTLIFSTFSGSTINNFGYTATFDNFGYLYSGSTAFGIGYPTTLGAYQTTFAGGTGNTPQGGNTAGTDIVITKWDTNGTAPIYSTYIGGNSDELPHSLIVNDRQELLLMGTTSSLNYPTTSNAFDTTFNINPNNINPVNLLNGLGVFYPNGSDICISKFDSSGSALLASTFLGGTHNDGLNTAGTKFNYADEVRGEILVDPNSNVYVVSTTRSNDNPTNGSSFQSTKPGAGSDQDGIIYKLNYDLSALDWSAYLGGGGGDAVYSVALTGNNDIVVTGGTRSNNFPVTLFAYDTNYGGATDGFVSRISSDGSTLIYSSFYGTNGYDQSYFVEVDNNDYVYLFGQTSGGLNTLIFNAAYNDPLGGQFVVKMGPQLDTLEWATRFGRGDGNPDISPTAFLVDLCNAVYLSGWGSSIQFGTLTTNGLDTAGGPIQGTTDNNDFYVAVIADDASQLEYATFFGGSAQEHVDGGTSRFDRKGKIYQAVCAGCGGTSDFPTSPNPGAHSNVNAAAPGCNLAVFKIDFLLPIVVADFLTDETGCAPYNASFNNLSLTQSATSFFWDFGDGNSSTLANPNHTYAQSGTYDVTLVVSDQNTCNLTDTLTKTVTVLSDSSYTLSPDSVCYLSPTTIGFDGSQNPPGTSYQWSPSTFLDDPQSPSPTVTTPFDITYTVLVSNGTCTDTVSIPIKVDSVLAAAPQDTSICSADLPLTFTGTSSGTGSLYTWSTNGNFTDTLNNAPGDSTFTLQNPTAGLNVFHFRATNSRGCRGTDLMNVIVEDLANPLIADFDDPGEGCAPYTVNFVNNTNGTATTAYLWDFGNGDSANSPSPSYTFTQPGNFLVTLIASDTSACSQSDTTFLEITVDADSLFFERHLACLNQETQIGVEPLRFPGSTFSWLQSSLVSDPTLSNPTGVFTQDTVLLLIAQGICTDSIFDSITVEPIYADAEVSRILCSDELPYTLTGNSLGSAGIYVWSSNAGFTDTLNSVIDSTLAANFTDSAYTYFFAVESPNGCIETDSTVLTISDRLLDVTPYYQACFNDTVLLTSFNPAPILNPLSYNWSPLEGLLSSPDSANALVSPDSAQTYRLFTVNDSGCTRIDTVFVDKSTLNPALVDADSDQDTVVRSLSTTLRALPLSGNYTYLWSPATGLNTTSGPNPEASPPNTTTYTVTVTDASNPACAYESSHTIYVRDLICGEPDIYVPNAFSPDGDGLNDEVFVRGENVATLTFSIFNRWGERVFETTNQQQGWDGYFNGQVADPAVYVYQLEATCVDGQEFFTKGNITLLK